MNFMIGWEFWHWLALGMLLLMLEMLGINGFLLGIAVACLTVGGLLFLSPEMVWYWQWLWFAILSVAFTLVYWKKFRRFNHRTDQPQLNARTALLVGRKVPLLTPVINGSGKVQIGDALWMVRCADDLAQGATVEILAVEDMTLLVKPVAAAGANE